MLLMITVDTAMMYYLTFVLVATLLQSKL